MNVPLTSDLEEFVNQQVESGVYPSATEVVREGLRLLRERDDDQTWTLDELRKEIASGIEQADRGDVRPFDEQLAAEIKARGRERLAAAFGH